MGFPLQFLPPHSISTAFFIIGVCKGKCGLWYCWFLGTAGFSTDLLSRCLEESEATSLCLAKSTIWDVLCHLQLVWL